MWGINEKLLTPLSASLKICYNPHPSLFFIDFKEILRTILAEKQGAFVSQYPTWPRHCVTTHTPTLALLVYIGCSLHLCSREEHLFEASGERNNNKEFGNNSTRTFLDIWFFYKYLKDSAEILTYKKNDAESYLVVETVS